MELSGSHVYPTSIDAAIALFGEKSAIVDKYESMGHRNVEILELEADPDVVRVKTSRVVDVELPGFAKKALKPTNTMVQTDEWRRLDDGRWSGTFGVEVKGSPVRISGTMQLAPEPNGCRHDVTIDVQVKIPIIGGKVADWAGKNDVRRTLDAEFAFNEARLAG